MKFKIAVNLCLLIAFALSAVPQATGIAWHEWVSLLLLAPLLLHLLADWNWIVRVSSQISARLPGQTRFNLIWNWLLFFNTVIVTASGLLISEAALPVFRIPLQPDAFWRLLHNSLSNLLVAMLGVHIAMHWKWIAAALASMFSRRSKKQTASARRSNGRKSGRKPGSAFQTIFRSGVIVLAGCAISVAMWTTGFTPYAASVRQSAAAEQAGRRQPPPGGSSPLLYASMAAAKQAATVTFTAAITLGVLYAVQRRRRAD